jgi:hypothetical protein
VLARERLPLLELRPDRHPIEGQGWACVSYIPPREFRSPSYPNEELSRPLVKVRGVFRTRAEAEAHIKGHIQDVDSTIDVTVLPCFQWAGLDDDAVEDRAYMNADKRFDLGAMLREYHFNENHRISDTPSQRLATAIARQELAKEKGGEMPYDATLLPNIPPDASAPASAGLAGFPSEVTIMRQG